MVSLCLSLSLYNRACNGYLLCRCMGMFYILLLSFYFVFIIFIAWFCYYLTITYPIVNYFLFLFWLTAYFPSLNNINKNTTKCQNDALYIHYRYFLFLILILILILMKCEVLLHYFINSFVHTFDISLYSINLKIFCIFLSLSYFKVHFYYFFLSLILIGQFILDFIIF